MQIEDLMNPFGGMPNMGFPGVPTIIIGRKNLKKNHGSPLISPIKIFNNLDDIFESFFDSLADSVINEYPAGMRNSDKSNNNSESEDDHIELDQLDLSLNETNAINDNIQKQAEQPKQNINEEINKENNEIKINELKIEDVENHKDSVTEKYEE